MRVSLAHKGELFLFTTSPGKTALPNRPFFPEQVCLLEASPWRGLGQGELPLAFSPGRVGGSHSLCLVKN